MINKNAIKIIIACLFINIFSGSLLSMEPFDIRHFRIENLEGKRFDSRKALGEPFVISFFFTRCPPCWKEMPELFSYMKKEGRLHQLLFVDSYVEAEGIEVHDNPDTKRMIEKYAEDFKINPANVYFDDFGSLLKEFIKVEHSRRLRQQKQKSFGPLF